MHIPQLLVVKRDGAYEVDTVWRSASKWNEIQHMLFVASDNFKQRRMKALTSARRSHIANFIMPFPKLHQLDLRTSWSRERKHLSGHRMKNDQASQQASKQRCLRARSSHSTCIPKEPNLNQSLTPITENSSRSANHP